jgi:hypothetical protein
MDSDPEAAGNPLLREALRHRLDEVRDTVERLAERQETSPPVPSDDPEETLRVLMVRILPKVRDGGAASSESSSALVAVRTLRIPAREDLRFFDAWNSVYEKVGRSADAPFLREYVELLEWHLRVLAEQ